MTLDRLARELEATWHADIPISKAMGIEIVESHEHGLVIRAPLAPNVNVHGTAFAGSLYAIGALCGWGAVWLALRRRALDAHIVIAEARIRYARPVAGAIVASCDIDAVVEQDAIERLRASGRARLALECRIGARDDPDASLDGSYAVRARGD